ncbi:MAG: TolC family protein [Kofleriaceae bacterium]|nr:TolC family protein [Kofleriaceae bacterium]
MKRFLVLALVLAGCAPSMRELRGPVDADVARRLGPGLDPRTPLELDAVLAKPLDRQAAIKIAIANNQRLAAAYEELGIAGGGLATALALGPLEVDAAVRFGDNHVESEIDIVQSVLGLISSARRRAAARADVDAATAEATASTLRLAARVEVAFNDLLAAQQVLELRRVAFEAADAAALFRERMYDAGTTSPLAQARERAAREQARIAVGRAEANVESKREALNALLGLSGKQTKWTTSGRLPELPAQAPKLDDLETVAVTASLELVVGRARTIATANRAADARLRSVLPELGVGVSAEIHDGTTFTGVGPLVQLGIPLFDWGSGPRAQTNAAARKAGHELTAAAIELRAHARAARVTALATFQEARHIATVLVPLRQQILDESLKHYNAMDADPFALLLARQQLVDTAEQQLDAIRRYWNATAGVTALQRGVAIEPVATTERTQMPSAPAPDPH